MYCLRLTAPGSLDLTSFGSLLLLLLVVVWCVVHAYRCSLRSSSVSWSALAWEMTVAVAMVLLDALWGQEEEEARHALVRQCGLSVARRTIGG